MTKAQAISAMVLAEMSKGASPVDALKTVCGADVVDGMISDLYDELRARASR